MAGEYFYSFLDLFCAVYNNLPTFVESGRKPHIIGRFLSSVLFRPHSGFALLSSAYLTAQ
jgi:hypothetical protein